MHSSLNNYLEIKSKKFLSHEEELVGKNILSVESIINQFFIQFEFSWVNLTDQIFMSFLFHIEVGQLGHDIVRNLTLESPC